MQNPNNFKHDTKTRLTRGIIARLLMKNREHERKIKIHTLMLNGNIANIKRLRASLAA